MKPKILLRRDRDPPMRTEGIGMEVDLTLDALSTRHHQDSPVESLLQRGKQLPLGGQCQSQMKITHLEIAQYKWTQK